MSQTNPKKCSNSNVLQVSAREKSNTNDESNTEEKDVLRTNTKQKDMLRSNTKQKDVLRSNTKQKDILRSNTQKKGWYAQLQQFSCDERAKCVDWMCELSAHYDLSLENTTLGTLLLDRFLAHHKVHKKELQLAAAVCLWIAFKYHDDHGTRIKVCNVIHLCSSSASYTRRDVLDMERRILCALEYHITRDVCLGSLVDQECTHHERNCDNLYQKCRYLTFAVLLNITHLDYNARSVAHSIVNLAKHWCCIPIETLGVHDDFVYRCFLDCVSRTRFLNTHDRYKATWLSGLELVRRNTFPVQPPCKKRKT